MSHCVYPYCSKDGKVENYFRLPEGEELRKKWLAAIPQVLDLTQESLVGRVFLCSRHFHKSNFHFDSVGKIKSMKTNAVPSIFFVPPTSSDTDDPAMEDVSMELMDVDPFPPPTMSNVSDAHLYLKVRQEELKLLIFKERLKKEEDRLMSVQERVKTFDKDNSSKEVGEIYSSLVKKMKPIAPRRAHKRKPKTLEEVIVYMKKQRFLSEESLSILMYLFADIVLDEKQSPVHKEGLQCFAQYMAFFNTEVYEKIPSHFDISLPPILSVRKMANKHIGEPGWSQDAFASLKRLSSRYENGTKLVCSLLISGMSLKRKEEWDGKKVRGFVDLGPEVNGAGFEMDSDGIPAARSVLVLMVVPLEPQHLWRVPVAYFYVNRLSSMEKANVTREGILRLYEVGAVVLSVTCDVTFSDKSFLNLLGVSSDLLPQICPYFVHPADPLIRVHVVFDHCSLLTSVQNMWASSSGFKDNEGRIVHWKFVSELVKLQEAQAGGFTQTFDSPHWTWDSLYMKNRLFAQLFSEATANSLEYCCSVLKLSQFADCEGTVYFIRIMNRVSKLLKSRRYLKNRLEGQSEAFLKSEYLVVLDYLYHLRDENDQLLYIVPSGSIHLLYQTLMSCQELLRQVSGFSPHCVNLDELEIIFYIIRTYTGWCPTPTARQFTAAFSAHLEIFGYIASWGCAFLNNYWWIDSRDVSFARREGREVSKPDFPTSCVPLNMETQVLKEHLYPETDFQSFSSSHFVAVCVVKSLADVLHCESCLEALQEAPVPDNPLSLLLRKTCGAVLCPSVDVLRVCARAEHYLQVALKTSKSKIKSSIFQWRDKDFIGHVVMLVVRDFLENGLVIFSSLKSHLTECSPDSSHLYRLLRGISYCYVNMRLRNYKSWCQV